MTLPVLSGKELLKILSKIGFVVDRTKGDHVFLKHPDGRRVTIPLDTEINKHLFSMILSELKMDRKDFLRIYQEYG